LVVLLLIASNAFGPQTSNLNENGAVNPYMNGGWSFGFPAVRAAVAVPGQGSAISPEKNTLPAVGAGATVRAWKFLVPCAGFTGRTLRAPGCVC